MLREWLLEPARMLWSAVFVPVTLLVVILSGGLILDRRRGGRWVLRSARWAIPVMAVCLLYYEWLFEMPFERALRDLIVVSMLLLAWLLALDSIRPDSPMMMRLFQPSRISQEEGSGQSHSKASEAKLDQDVHDGQSPGG